MDFKKLIFISGKGGTGKTTLALIVARHLALQSKKVLFVELSPRSSAQSLLNLEQGPNYQPSKTPFGFDWSLMQGKDCLVEYISSFTGVEKITQKVFDSSVIKTLVNVAPGLNDLAVLGKLTSGMREHGPSFDYDHIVVDAHSTGSFQSLINAPKLLGRSVSTGPLKSQSEKIDEVLKDANLVQYFFMGLFESLPMDELEDTLAEFGESFKEGITVLMNKRLPIDESHSENSLWKNFIESQLREQKKQRERVKDLWDSVVSQDLITIALSDYLKKQQGEWLRPL